MRIASYNINGLRARLAQYRSLSLLLESLNSDIICFQETKVSRQELTADIAIAEGYESFFAFTRAVKNGRIAYSGVATFCRIGKTSSNTSPILPVAADEGFTGLLHFSRTDEIGCGKGRVGCYEEVFQTELSSQELLRLDSEGRCLVTDHGSFVLFNIYAPRVEIGDKDRQQFKNNFFHALQRRWEGLLSKGRRVIAVGDFNVTPYPIDHCDPAPDFDKHISRKWLRSILHAEGGPFRDVFRFIHPNRNGAYSCWSTVTGAEEFNYGTRIDLIIAAGPCSHEASGGQESNDERHSFVECEVLDSDILTDFRRVKNDTLPRWHGGRSLKLEGSDHAPVYVLLREQRQVEPHDVPPLAARFFPELRGRQQDLVSLLKRQPSPNGLTNFGREGGASPSGQKTLLASNSFKDQSKNKGTKRKLGSPVSTNKHDAGQKQSTLRTFFVTSTKNVKASVDVNSEHDKKVEPVSYQETSFEGKCTGNSPNAVTARLPARAIEKQIVTTENTEGTNLTMSAEEEVTFQRCLIGAIEELGYETPDGLDYTEVGEFDRGRLSQSEANTMSDTQKPNAASEWKRIQNAMARALPLCSGHKEPCVARVVKKAGPNIGRGFYVCARAEGPSSNPETRCDHFEWSSSSMRAKGKVLGK
ncbi:hypothetical protein Mapa_004925 [Marchantia paleacea]|nr:hypothetical protein Mapa_004925 [Marchantia paleacea]